MFSTFYVHMKPNQFSTTSSIHKAEITIIFTGSSKEPPKPSSQGSVQWQKLKAWPGPQVKKHSRRVLKAETEQLEITSRETVQHFGPLQIFNGIPASHDLLQEITTIMTITLLPTILASSFKCSLSTMSGILSNSKLDNNLVYT